MYYTLIKINKNKEITRNNLFKISETCKLALASRIKLSKYVVRVNLKVLNQDA